MVNRNTTGRTLAEIRRMLRTLIRHPIGTIEPCLPYKSSRTIVWYPVDDYHIVTVMATLYYDVANPCPNRPPVDACMSFISDYSSGYLHGDYVLRAMDYQLQ